MGLSGPALAWGHVLYARRMLFAARSMYGHPPGWPYARSSQESLKPNEKQAHARGIRKVGLPTLVCQTREAVTRKANIRPLSETTQHLHLTSAFDLPCIRHTPRVSPFSFSFWLMAAVPVNVVIRYKSGNTDVNRRNSFNGSPEGELMVSAESRRQGQ
jgi:hypothetical protein